MSPCIRRGRWPARSAQAARLLGGALVSLAAAASLPAPALAQTGLPVLPQWQETAQRVAQAGVPLEDLAPNAPESHTVQRGDTLWGISSLFLKSPWRWPELWGMNLEQIRNPHLIYPGQVLVLEKRDGRATLRVAGPGQAAAPTAFADARLSPRVRSESLDNGAIATIALNLIGPFLNEAVIFERNELDTAPRIVATQEGRVMVTRGETAYVRGELGSARDFRLFRELKPLTDPQTGEVLGYEGRYVGTAELVQPGQPGALVVPATMRIASTRLEAGVGDRLSPVPPQDLVAYAPRAPLAPIDGRIVSIYGEGLSAGQNQVVAINRGQRDGLDRGNVLALWRAGRTAVDTTTPGQRTLMRLPDERHGLLFVFRVFERVAYALVLSVQEPVARGDRFTQP